MKIAVLGWARHLVSATTSDSERAVHAVVANGWQRVALCGEPCPNGFADIAKSPNPSGPYPVCRTCEGLVLDALGVTSTPIEDLRVLLRRSPSAERDSAIRSRLASMGPLSRAEGAAMVARAGVSL
jgi:hypothetical protein